MRNSKSWVYAKVAFRPRPDSHIPSGFDKHRKTVEDSLMRLELAGIAIALLLVACATSPPVQEMAEARSAIQTAKGIPNSNLPADLALRSAEQMLKEAADAIREEKFEQARQLALSAKRKAQSAVQYKQKP